MPRHREGPSRRRVEQIIGLLLLCGVLTSAAVVLLGGGVHLARHGRAPVSYHVFRGEPSDLRSVSGIVGDAFSFRGRGLIQFGLLLLIATPVVRVAFSAIAFAFQRDPLYVAVTLIVLTLLIFSLAGGHL